MWQMQTRREFLVSSALLGVAACTRSGSPTGMAPRAMPPLGFSTLGAPAWSWIRILDVAKENGFETLELRGIEGEMDLSKVPALAPARLADARRELAERGLRVVCLGSSANMHEFDPAKRAAQFAEARRFIELAPSLGAPFVRVFPNQWVRGVERERVLQQITSGLRELGSHAREHGVTILVESHGEFTDSATLLSVLQRADSPAVALLWDAHHTFVSGGESPEESVRRLGPWIRHVHLKDSVPEGTGRRYVLTGAGTVPVRRQVEALVKLGYAGAYSFEWEKRWHPEIEAPEIAIPHFARTTRSWLREALPNGTRLG